MTRDEFKILVKAMKAVYTQPSFIPDQDAFDVWYGMLKDLDYRAASYAVKKHMQVEEKEPRVASIRKHAVGLAEKEDEINEMEAWQMVLRAMRNSIYHADEEFAKLPFAVQKAVVNPGQLREWAMSEDVDGTWMNVTQSNFMRTYRAEISKLKEQRKLSPELMKLGTMDAKSNTIQDRYRVIPDNEAEGNSPVSMPKNAKMRLAELLG